MVHREKQSIIIQLRDFLNTPCFILQIEVSKFSPKHFYREGKQTKQTKNSTKE